MLFGVGRSGSIFQTSYPRAVIGPARTDELWEKRVSWNYILENSPQRIKLKLRGTIVKELNCSCKSLPSVLGNFERSLSPFCIRKTNLWWNARANGNFNDPPPHLSFSTWPPRGNDSDCWTPVDLSADHNVEIARSYRVDGIRWSAELSCLVYVRFRILYTYRYICTYGDPISVLSPFQVSYNTVDCLRPLFHGFAIPVILAEFHILFDKYAFRVAEPSSLLTKFTFGDFNVPIQKGGSIGSLCVADCTKPAVTLLPI